MRVLGFRMRVVETLISINALAFIITLISPGLIAGLFALQPLTLAARPWTVVTSMFLHADFMHIFFNMYSLYFFGLYLEQMVGEKNLLKLFFLGGIAGNMAYALSSLLLGIPDPATIAIGASSAIFAMAGALAMLKPNMRIIMIPIFIPMPLYIVVLFFMVLLSFMPGVAWQGHLGGLAVGLLFGYFWKKKMVEVVSVRGGYGYRFY
jgi:membrane associated rhomboid family serine protease